MQHSSDETEDTSPDSALDDFEPQHTTRDTSPADGQMDEEEMFALDMGELKVVEEEPAVESAQKHQQHPLMPKQLELPPMRSQQQSQIPFAARWDTQWAPHRHSPRMPYGEMGISAPSQYSH